VIVNPFNQEGYNSYGSNGFRPRSFRRREPQFQVGVYGWVGGGPWLCVGVRGGEEDNDGSQHCQQQQQAPIQGEVIVTPSTKRAVIVMAATAGLGGG
jgi:hypothetical protein